MAGQFILERYQEKSSFDSQEDIKEWLNNTILKAHLHLQQKGQENISFRDMGTTVVVAVIKDEKAYISHVGDSRAYYYDGEHLEQLTRDDTLVNVLVDTGTISEEEAFFHPQKNILLQAVGVSSQIQVSYLMIDFHKGMIILCSDGLYNSLFESQIIDILKQEKSLSGNEYGTIIDFLFYCDTADHGRTICDCTAFGRNVVCLLF